MSALDWLVVLLTGGGILGWGLWRERRTSATAAGYLRGGALPWHTVGLSVMATQASAITFLSVPGQAYEDGMRFVQFYFGLPLAMVVLSAVVLPIYVRLRVTTAYEYLEARFDAKTRVLGAVLFLIQRGLAAGITIYAPAIILATVLGWPLKPTVVALGGVVVLYTVTGGSAVVARTQKAQMVVMLAGMAVAGAVALARLPGDIGVGDAMAVAGALGRLEAITWRLDLHDRYNIWSGLAGGFFLSLAYFGTDQSQVGRYLHARSLRESRLGLLFNGALKIPMQAMILLVGVAVFVFYVFVTPPLLLQPALRTQVAQTPAAPTMLALQGQWEQAQQARRQQAYRLVQARRQGDAAAEDAARAALVRHHAAAEQVRARARATVEQALPGAKAKDTDFVFIGFVVRWLPEGLVGLLVAAILFAAMSSTASELNALGSTTTVDLWQRLWRPRASDAELLVASRGWTVVWGGVAIAFASFAALVENLIQAVNILGSIFYGTVLGIFAVAFAMPWVQGRSVFPAALVAQAGVIGMFFGTEIGFLWYNFVGCAVVMLLSAALEWWWGSARASAER